jgi:YidC/Oxa1 family membrane protein insertase
MKIIKGDDQEGQQTTEPKKTIAGEEPAREEGSQDAGQEGGTGSDNGTYPGEGDQGFGSGTDTKEAPEQIVTVRTENVIGKFSSLEGGTIVSWELRNFKDKDQSGDPLQLIPFPVDTNWRNLGIILEGQGGDTLLRNNFHLEKNTVSVENGDSIHQIIFTKNLKVGGRIVREYLIPDDSYYFRLNIRIEGIESYRMGSHYSLLWQSGMKPTEANIGDDRHYYEAYAFQGDNMEKTKDEIKEDSDDTDWIAVRTKYFVTAIIPENTTAKGMRMQGREMQVYHNGMEPDSWKRFDLALKMPYSQTEQSFLVYMGPMDYRELKSFDRELEKMMNFGWTIIRPFSIGFYYTLEFLYGLVRNYGLAIIIFSILIKVVLYPLTKKSFQSMRKMQELQPKLSALKEKYKSDPQKLNQETMKMY